MQQTYPGLDPARYADTDERFRTFINCGARSMREYGEAVRQAAAVEYGGAAALVEKVYGKEGLAGFSWDTVYDKGLDLLLRAAEAEVQGQEEGEAEEAEEQWRRLRVGGGQGDEGVGVGVGGQRLCSASRWDPASRRCGSRRDAAPQGGGAGEGGWDAVDKALDEA